MAALAYTTNTRNATSPAQTNCGTTFASTGAAGGYIELTALTGNVVCRGSIFEIGGGADGAPNTNDCQIVYSVVVTTASGTGVASVPNATDRSLSTIPPARAQCKINMTTNGTFTANSTVWSEVMNQRNSFIWKANTGCELIWPATTANGFTIGALSPTYAAPVGITTYWWE